MDLSISRPYYETRANYNAKLRNLKSRIIEMETEVQQAKASYNEALQSLEKISDEIHKLKEDQKLNEYHEEVGLRGATTFSKVFSLIY